MHGRHNARSTRNARNFRRILADGGICATQTGQQGCHKLAPDRLRGVSQCGGQWGAGKSALLKGVDASGVEALQRLIERLNAGLERILPERRIFLRSETETRFLRLRPLGQAVALGGSALVLGWALLATAILLMDSVGSGNLQDQARRDQAIYEARLADLSAERDLRAAEARMANDRFAQALQRVSEMQSQLLASEQRRTELESAIETIQASLRSVIRARDAARAEAETLRLAAAGELASASAALSGIEDATDMVAFLSDSLQRTALERDALASTLLRMELDLDHLQLEATLMADRNDRIFRRLEEAVSVSMEPLERVFRAAGMPPQQILDQVRQGYQQTPALSPITISSQGGLEPGSDEARAEAVLAGLRRINTYRVAAERLPLAEPVHASVRMTSGFGVRRDPRTGASRMHNGVDWAGPRGTPIHTTSDGTVVFAGWQGGYGNLVIVEHAFGIRTYYAHLHRIRVNQGDRVSRGDRIGDMGTTGRSTGVHLHYEIRVGGRPVNPMTFIRAGRDVF